MASQRVLIATIAGDSAVTVANLFASWRSEIGGSEIAAVDRFCEALRSNADALQVVYYCEWIDRWLMGDRIPGPGTVEGRRFQATCLTREETIGWAGHCGTQFEEQIWLATRLREAATARKDLANPAVIVIVREVLGSTTTDEEVLASLGAVPGWLTT
jgi:hypothetical protein